MNATEQNINKLMPTVHLTAMLKALRKVKGMEIEEDYTAGTVKVTWASKARPVVLRAINKGGDAWIISHHPMLFEV